MAKMRFDQFRSAQEVKNYPYKENLEQQFFTFCETTVRPWLQARGARAKFWKHKVDGELPSLVVIVDRDDTEWGQIPGFKNFLRDGYDGTVITPQPQLDVQ